MSLIDQKLHPMREHAPLQITDALPSNSLGANGDCVLVLTEGNYYQKVDGLWVLAGNSGSSGGGAKTLRNVATRCRHNYQVTSASRAVLSRTFHQNLGSPVTSLKVVIGNWIANNTGEANGPGTSTEYLAIEFPAGVYHMAKWNGADFTTCAAGSNVTTDAIPVQIGTGDGFWIRRLEIFASDVAIPVSANAILAPSTVETGASYIWTAAQWSAVTNDPRTFVCGTAGVSGAAGGAWSLYPLAVLGMSNVPSVIVYGDSRASGRNDASSTVTALCDFGSWGMGEICRSIGRALPYTNVGCESDTIQQFNLTNTQRKNLAQYHTHVHFQYGINDLTANRTAAVIEAALSSAYALFPSQKVSQSTIPPVTTSTDSWVTTANQTPVASNGARTTLNDWIRTTPAPLWTYFDVADVVESTRNSGIWNVSGGVALTGDGTHETPLGYQMIQQSGAINTALFV